MGIEHPADAEGEELGDVGEWQRGGFGMAGFEHKRQAKVPSDMRNPPPLHPSMTGALDDGLDDVAICQPVEMSPCVAIGGLQLREFDELVTGHDAAGIPGFPA